MAGNIVGADDGVVRIETVSKVKPATSTDAGGKRRVVFLTSCDLVCRTYPYINRLFFFKRSSSRREQLECAAIEPWQVSLMKEGLAEALVSFYPLSGRLSVGEEGRLQIECGGNEAVEEIGGGGVEVEFVEASCDLPFATLAQDGFQYRHIFLKLARRTHYVRSDYLHEPILSVQITKFSDGGGYSVGVSISHVVVDAQSFYDFVKCWAEVCRGAPMSVPPVHMREALSVGSLFPAKKLLSEPFNVSKSEPPNVAVTAAIDELAKEVQEQTSFMGKPASIRQNVKVAVRTQAPLIEKQSEEEEHRRPKSDDLVQKVFSFSSKKLKQLKQRVDSSQVEKLRPPTHECNEDEQSKHNTVTWGGAHGFTTFEAFCAHWWQCLIRARCLVATQPVFLLIPINCRLKFLGLPQGYFGNALDGGLVKMTCEELCEAQLCVVASKIHEAIRQATEEAFKLYIKEAERMKNVIPHFDRTNLFHISDSPKFPVYDVDFGFGTPKAVRAEGLRFGAEVQILAGRLEPNSYDLFCALDRDTMQRLEQDPAFLLA